MYYFDEYGWLTDEPIAGRSTEVAPMAAQGSKRPNWLGREWALLPYVPPEGNPRLDAQREQLTAAATAQRWATETGGITLPNGVRIKTGTDDQARVTSVIANARLANIAELSFKAANGWITLTLEEVEAIAAAVALHVQACFDAERAHHEAIEALPDLESAQAYDVTEGWPA